MKMVVVRHEHNTQSAAKARSKSACELRQHVDDHKQELERLERKLLTSSKTIELYIIMKNECEDSIAFHLYF